jgi:hypothetical protein
MFVCIALPAAAADKLPAFPGAEGAGAYARGGRGGDVYCVTSLNDDGPGSLRHGVQSATGPRTVVFAVSGTVRLKSDLTIDKSNITVAGQTAPGDGICLADHQLVLRDANDVIVQYIRVRPGDEARKALDSISVYSGNDIIIDHCSASWSVDETLSVSPSPKDAKLDRVTVQWCMITESLNKSEHKKGSHGYAALIRGHSGAEYSYHHNLFAHHRGRSPRPGNYVDHKKDPKGLRFDFRNNVVYNWDNRMAGYNADKKSISRYNFINNYYIPGPNSDGKFAFREGCSRAKAYFAGNWMAGSLPKDPWRLVMGKQGGAYRQPKAFVTAKVTTQAAPDAYKLVLAKAGASLSRDAVDTRIVKEVQTGKGRIIDDEQDVGGWPKLATLKPPRDSDRDGMPDDYEKALRLNPNNPKDRNGDLNKDGYTNLENYLHSLTGSGGK